jgi:uncharacterized protein (TIGR02145 family)
MIIVELKTDTTIQYDAIHSLGDNFMNIIGTNRHIITVLLSLLTATVSLPVSGQETSHSCGSADVHNANVSYGKVTDIDGNAYKTVTIDRLVWFAENLRSTRFQNGDSIPNVPDSAAWSVLKSPGMCSYRNDPTFDCPQGKLYNQHVALDERNPCPLGWRVPTIADFNNLINTFDPDANGGAPSSLPNSAGGALKNVGSRYWSAPNPNATNVSGFSAIPNGGRANSGAFSSSNDRTASYWYASQVGPGMGFFLELAYTQDFAVRNAYWAEYGVCIRCVQDLPTSINETGMSTTHVFPNPADESLHLTVASTLIGSEYVVSDLTGRVVLRGSIHAESVIVSIADLHVGMYLLSTPNAKTNVIKVVKR